MLTELPFLPTRLNTRDRLLLLPHCHDQKKWRTLQATAENRARFLGAELLNFPRYTLVTGFMGYPHLLTLLACIEGWREKSLLFLGTAGVLGEERIPAIASVDSLDITPELSTAFSSQSLPMEPLSGVMARRVVTVDLPQRETESWALEQSQQRPTWVEMELFPLRWLYGRPFRALLVGSDRVGGARVPYAAVVTHFSLALTQILEHCHET